MSNVVLCQWERTASSRQRRPGDISSLTRRSATKVKFRTWVLRFRRFYYNIPLVLRGHHFDATTAPSTHTTSQQRAQCSHIRKITTHHLYILLYRFWLFGIPIVDVFVTRGQNVCFSEDHHTLLALSQMAATQRDTISGRRHCIIFYQMPPSALCTPLARTSNIISEPPRRPSFSAILASFSLSIRYFCFLLPLLYNYRHNFKLTL